MLSGAGSENEQNRVSQRFRLIDKVWSPKNLGRSLEKVVAKGGSAGVDHQSVGQIKARKDQTRAKLEQELRANQYQPQAVKGVWIPKAGSKEKRPLGVPTLRDSNCARSPAPRHRTDL
jgi:retron-type reverse transcriptase